MIQTISDTSTSQAKGTVITTKMGRLNGEIRDREKVFRGLKKIDTPILDGMRVLQLCKKARRP